MTHAAPRQLWSSVWGFLVIVFVLSILGTLFVFEASVAEALATFGDQWYVVRQHVMWLGVGWLAIVAGYCLPVSWWKKAGPLFFGAALLMMVLVFLPGLGKSVNGARRWVALGSFTFQPVEAMKLGLIIFFATWLTKHQRLRPFLFFTGLPMALLILQPDLGSALIVGAIAFGMYVVAGARWRTVIGILAVGILAVAALIIISPYRLKRMTTYLNPEADPLGASFHVRQLTLALGNGGWLGQGIGKSKQKFSYLPEASTDSIFAIVAEEVGFIGSAGIITLLLLWIRQAVKITRSVQGTSFIFLLGSGLTIWFAAQTILNLAAVVALVPLTGIPLPFFSYGGTALVTMCFACGMLAGLPRHKQSASAESASPPSSATA